MTERGSPKVKGSIAFLDCDVVGAHPHGDHTIFVGEVKDAVAQDGEPLVFFEGRFQALDRS
jgi:flavin reductase (DIM6/NTAB) family NADH-FMN oxidoreductase RutF